MLIAVRPMMRQDHPPHPDDAQVDDRPLGATGLARSDPAPLEPHPDGYEEQPDQEHCGQGDENDETGVGIGEQACGGGAGQRQEDRRADRREDDARKSDWMTRERSAARHKPRPAATSGSGGRPRARRGRRPAACRTWSASAASWSTWSWPSSPPA